ncbi:MAG: PAS domain S-box protein [Halodesulfurarchaeum sp.]|nr:PAS domain S-box protein [Halodesulfurarchaeum sp.]
MDNQWSEPIHSLLVLPRDRESEEITPGLESASSRLQVSARTTKEIVCERAIPPSTDCIIVDMGIDEAGELADNTPVYERLPKVPVIGLFPGREFEAHSDRLVEWPVETVLPRRLARDEPEIVADYVLEATEQWFRREGLETLVDRIPGMVSVHDPTTGELIRTNRSFRTVLDTDRTELQGLNPDRITAQLDGEDGETLTPVITALEAEDGPSEVEWGVSTPSGVRWLEIEFRLLRLGQREYVLGTGRDVTKRRTLRETYRDLFESVSDGLVVHSAETGEILDVNDRFCEMNGYERQELLGETVDLVTAPEYGYEDVQERIRRAREEEPQLFEWRNQHRDGETFPVEVHLRVVTIRGEEQVLASVRDVTDRKRSEFRLSTILDRIDEAIFLTKAELITEASQSPEYVSSGYEDIWGQSLEQLRDRYEDGFFGTLHPDDESMYRAHVERIVEDVDSGTASDRYSIEYRIRTPAGETRWVHSDFYPVAWIVGPPRIVILSRDVTDKKRRERRLVAFEAATEDLTTADSFEEAADSAVSAAADSLGLSMVGVYLYEKSAGTLEPEIMADSLPAVFQDRSIDPGDGGLWESFVTGSIAGPERESLEGVFPWDKQGALSDWRAIPLGNHGLLLVGTASGTIDPDQLQSALVLAGTLEAALNHLQGRKQLADREAALRTETERADRLEEIVDVTHEVEGALTEATDPAEIEGAVCRRLVSNGPFEVAWIGRVPIGVDQLRPERIEGATEAYLENLPLRTETTPADPHPAIEAWEAGSIRIENSLLANGPHGNWREIGLGQGIQSVCAVPLSYEGVKEGVLCVESKTPNEFDDRIREVLDQLGTSIGHALSAIERRRALETAERIELEFQGSEAEWDLARFATASESRVTHERTVHQDDGHKAVYFNLQQTGHGEPIDLARQHLDGDVEAVDGNGGIIKVVTDSWLGTRLAEHGGLLRQAEASPDRSTILVELSGHADVRSFVSRVDELVPGLELTAKHQLNRSRSSFTWEQGLRDQLTDRQFEALRTAYRAGYFEWPRDRDGSEVAAELGITQPTLNKHLRIAERTLLGELFD